MFFLVAAATAVFTSCDRQNDIVPSEQADHVALELRTEFALMTRSVVGRPISSFTSGDELGLFITNGTGVDNPYAGVAAHKNMRSTYTTAWALAAPVYLSGNPATIYAYYPYSSSATSGSSIAVDHTSQTDFLYGSASGTVNNRNHVANITMHHALSLVRFNIQKENYNGVGRVTAIRIANKQGGNALASNGTMNITTGAITAGSGREAVTKATNLPATIGTWSEAQYPAMMVIPTSATAAAGDIVVTFTIDGVDYTYPIPQNTTWAKGKKNTYTLTLRGTSMQLFPTDNPNGSTVTIEDWTTGVSGTGTIS